MGPPGLEKWPWWFARRFGGVPGSSKGAAVGFLFFLYLVVHDLSELCKHTVIFSSLIVSLYFIAQGALVFFKGKCYLQAPVVISEGTAGTELVSLSVDRPRKCISILC